MDKVKVISKQIGLVVTHIGKPSYKLTFNKDPLEVNQDVADHLIRNDNFVILKEETKEVKKK